MPSFAILVFSSFGFYVRTDRQNHSRDATTVTGSFAERYKYLVFSSVSGCPGVYF